MYCSTSITAQLLRGVLALASIVAAIWLTPHFWPAAGLLLLAIYLMRGCPACWMVGLFEAIRARKEARELKRQTANPVS
jgi:hypothetical protein